MYSIRDDQTLWEHRLELERQLIAACVALGHPKAACLPPTPTPSP